MAAQLRGVARTQRASGFRCSKFVHLQPLFIAQEQLHRNHCVNKYLRVQ
jgi:hypothetical protein